MVFHSDRFDPESQATTLVCLASPPRLSSVFFFGCLKIRKNPGGDTGKKNWPKVLVLIQLIEVETMIIDNDTLNIYTPENQCPVERHHFKRGHVTFQCNMLGIFSGCSTSPC